MQLGLASSDGQDYNYGEVMAEKLVQELLWFTYKLKIYGDVNDALLQRSLASSLPFFYPFQRVPEFRVAFLRS